MTIDQGGFKERSRNDRGDRGVFPGGGAPRVRPIIYDISYIIDPSADGGQSSRVFRSEREQLDLHDEVNNGGGWGGGNYSSRI